MHPTAPDAPSAQDDGRSNDLPGAQHLQSKALGHGEQLFMGLMSGTSLDGVDAVLVDFSAPSIRTLGHAFTPFDAAFKDELLALNSPGSNELHRANLASNKLSSLYAQTCLSLLKRLSISPNRIIALGAHGQTIRHQPQAHDAWGYTTQLLSAHLLAELTGMDVIHDFRSRDLFAGGQGAPLVPAFHQQVFASPDALRVILNIGGMSNVSILPPVGTPLSETVESQDASHARQRVAGFDCGPGNVLMDLWCAKHTGKPFDEDGQWAQQGHVHEGLLAHLLAEPFFHLPPPKSTGRDLFNATWLEAKLAAFKHVAPQDVQATLCALTAHSILLALDQHLKAGLATPTLSSHLELVVCGGGALNTTLVHHLVEFSTSYQTLQTMTCLSSEDLGCPPQEVEAVAFAWLARQRVLGLSANLPQVTGAKGTRVLGSWVRA